MVTGTAASVTTHPHWAVRNWDFPRLQIAVVTAACAFIHVALFFRFQPFDFAFLAALGATFAFQCFKIFPYTRLSPVEVELASESRAPRIKLLISNVLMENQEYGRLLEVIQRVDPDVVLAVETDADWIQGLEPLVERYPHWVRHPQDNHYGMVLYSRLPLHDARTEFLVQDDIPSMHAQVELPGGTRVWLHGLHPRPPEPLRNQDSGPRDDELLLMGWRIQKAGDRPTIVAGDLNDVAWSGTSQLFLQVSELRDPRIGRGFYSSFPTHLPPVRCPLDHVFHSHHFRLVKLERLPAIGSDHFPMFIELSFEPAP